MFCHRQEDSGGGGRVPPARVAVPGSTLVGSPLQAAGDKPQKAGTENKQKPCLHKLWFDRLGKVGSSSQGAGKKEPRAKGGVSYSRRHKVPRPVPPSNAHPHLSKKTTLASILTIGRWGWNKSTVQLGLSTAFRRRWGCCPVSEHPVP